MFGRYQYTYEGDNAHDNDKDADWSSNGPDDHRHVISPLSRWFLSRHINVDHRGRRRDGTVYLTLEHELKVSTLHLKKNIRIKTRLISVKSIV